MSTIPSFFQVPKDSEKDYETEALVSKTNTFWFKVSDTPVQTESVSYNHRDAGRLNRQAMVYASLSLLVTFGLTYLAWTRRVRPLLSYSGATVSLVPTIWFAHSIFENCTVDAEPIGSSNVEIYSHIKRLATHTSKPLPVALAILSTLQGDVDVFSTFCRKLNPREIQLGSLPSETAFSSLNLQGDWIAVLAKRELWEPTCELHCYSNVTHATDPTTHPSIVLTALPDQKTESTTVFSWTGKVNHASSMDDAIWHSFCFHDKAIKVSFNLAPVHETDSIVFYTSFMRKFFNPTTTITKAVQDTEKKLEQTMESIRGIARRERDLAISEAFEKFLHHRGDQGPKGDVDEPEGEDRYEA